MKLFMRITMVSTALISAGTMAKSDLQMIQDVDKLIASLQSQYQYNCTDDARLTLCETVVDSSKDALSALKSLKSPDMQMQARIVKLEMLQKTAKEKIKK